MLQTADYGLLAAADNSSVARGAESPVLLSGSAASGMHAAVPEPGGCCGRWRPGRAAAAMPSRRRRAGQPGYGLLYAAARERLGVPRGRAVGLPVEIELAPRLTAVMAAVSAGASDVIDGAEEVVLGRPWSRGPRCPCR